MLLKCRRSKTPIKGSSFRTKNGDRDENLPINPPIQTLSILRALMKASIDRISFNVFPAKFCKDLYTKVYHHKSFVLERQIHLDSFKDT